MKVKYEDILNRIKEEPLWWDDNGVPRYDEFLPSLVPNIYAHEVALILISCQCCDREFRVSQSWDRYSYDKFGVCRSLSSQIPHVYYGDPPNVGCCPPGPTMNSNPIKIIEFWGKEDGQWVRKREFEMELEE